MALVIQYAHMKHNTKHIGEYELIDHGIDHCQYFQGCGTAFTSFSECVTGCGNNAAEAIDDALEMAAQAGFEVDGLNERMLADEKRKTWPKRPAVSVNADETYYYVSIRFNVA
jgi:hypothetical protein